MIARTLAAALGVALLSPLAGVHGAAAAAAFGPTSLISRGIATGESNAPLHRWIAPADRGIAADVPRVRDGRDLGRVASNAPIHIALLMRAQHESDMATLSMLQGVRGSRYYHRYLTARQFTNYFGPSPLTYAKTQQRLRAAGFRITQTFANRGMISATATAAYAERYFRTRFDYVSQPGRKLAYANVTPAIMPAELASDVVSVAGLHSTVQVHTFYQRSKYTQAQLHNARMRTILALATARERAAAAARRPVAVALATPTADPRPISTTTPIPGPQKTELLESPFTDLSNAAGPGYGPPIFATSYDFPVQHGYDGTGHAAGSVIDSDYNSLDMAGLASAYSITRKANSEHRVCTGGDPTACAICTNNADGTTTGCDAEGESTLDAEAIGTLAPGADFYEYLTPTFSDVGIEGAYEQAVNDDVVEALNSSFGGCETDDPAFQYSSNYIAQEGALEGITFSASTGDTGATNCGTYATNGAPQTYVNASTPSSAYYFTAVGGTSYDTLVTCTTTSCYTAEQAWLDGGGGSSVFEPLPSWQKTTVANASVAAMVPTTGRDTPDVSLTADGGAEFVGGTQGNGLIICTSVGSKPPCTLEGSGGTSLSSPMFIALQTTINEVQGSRNGWVNPRLYAINNAFADYAFRDITVGTNNRYIAATGYDTATGLGSPLGFELAGAE